MVRRHRWCLTTHGRQLGFHQKFHDDAVAGSQVIERRPRPVGPVRQELGRRIPGRDRLGQWSSHDPDVLIVIDQSHWLLTARWYSRPISCG